MITRNVYVRFQVIFYIGHIEEIPCFHRNAPLYGLASDRTVSWIAQTFDPTNSQRALAAPQWVPSGISPGVSAPPSTENLCAMRLRDRPKVPPTGEKLLSERPRRRKGVIAEEIDNPRQVANSRCLFVIFPPAHRKLLDLEQRCHVLLPQSEFVSSLLEMAAHRLRIGGVGLRTGSFQRYLAVWQKGNASMGRRA